MKRLKSKDIEYLRDIVYPKKEENILPDTFLEDIKPKQEKEEKYPLEKLPPQDSLSPKERYKEKRNYEEWLNRELNDIFTSSFTEEWKNDFDETFDDSVEELEYEIKEKIKKNLFKVLRSDVLGQGEKLSTAIINDLVSKYREEIITRLNTRRESITRDSEKELKRTLNFLTPKREHPYKERTAVLKKKFHYIFNTKQKIALLIIIPFLYYFINKISPFLYFNVVSPFSLCLLVATVSLYSFMKEKTYFYRLGILRAFHYQNVHFRFVTFFIRNIFWGFVLGFIVFFDVNCHLIDSANPDFINHWIVLTNHSVPFILHHMPSMEVLFFQKTFLYVLFLLIILFFIGFLIKRKKYY